MSHVDDLIPQLINNGGRTIRELDASGKVHAATFASLHSAAIALLSRLAAAGIRASSRVGIFGKNSSDWIVADLALIELQCLSVAIPFGTGAEQQDYRAICDTHNLTALIVIGARPGSAGDLIEIYKHPRPGRIASSRAQFDPDALTVMIPRHPVDPPRAITISKRDTSNAIESFVNVWAPTSQDHLLVVTPFTNFQQRFLVYLAIKYGFDITLAPHELMHQALKRFAPTIMSNESYLWMSLGGRSFPGGAPG